MKSWRQALRSFWRAIRWPVIGGLAILALAFGYAGFDSYLARTGVPRSFWDKLYLSLQLFGLESGNVEPPVPAALGVARLLAPLVTGYAAVSAVAGVFREQIARARVRWFANDHVVVCGLGRTGRILAREFSDANSRVVAVENDPHDPAIEECRREGVTVLVGDAADRTLLAQARVDRARYLFAVSDDDAVNAQIAVDAGTMVSKRRGAPLTCFVRILDVNLAELLQAEMASRSSGALRLEFFNPSQRGAPALLNEHPPFDDSGATRFGSPHLLVVGLGEMGSRLVLQAARVWKQIVGPDGARLQVIVVDNNAANHVEALLVRYPTLGKICDLSAVTTDVEDPDFDRGDFLFGEDGRCLVTSAYVCLDDDARGLSAALRLRRHLRDRRRIVVRTKQYGGLGALVGTAAHEDLHVFGLLDLTCKPEVLLTGRTDQLARAIHTDYVRKQKEKGTTPAENPSMVLWEELPEYLRESNRRQADDIGNKLSVIGCGIDTTSGLDDDTFVFTEAEIERLAREEHKRWSAERQSDGWTYAPEKDVNRKKSPYLVPWEDLSEEVRELDRDAVRVIPVSLARAGFRVVRPREARDGEDSNE